MQFPITTTNSDYLLTDIKTENSRSKKSVDPHSWQFYEH